MEAFMVTPATGMQVFLVCRGTIESQDTKMERNKSQAKILILYV